MVPVRELSETQGERSVAEGVADLDGVFGRRRREEMVERVE
jgi:hypothetical protein